MLCMDTDLARITVEAVSAIACLILVRFMLKPYQLKKQGRYLGLPLGFGILGINYVFTIMLFTPPFLHNAALSWLAHFTRVFAFVFLALTYYFSTKTTQTYRLLWDLTLSLLIVALVASSLILIYTPQADLMQYTGALLFIRSLTIVFLSYIIIHTLRNYRAHPELTKLWVPIGFIFLAISQCLLLVTAVLPTVLVTSSTSFWGWCGLAVRLAGLAVFLLVAYRTFYNPKENQ
jgi:hypothetical protein